MELSCNQLYQINMQPTLPNQHSTNFAKPTFNQRYQTDHHTTNITRLTSSPSYFCRFPTQNSHPPQPPRLRGAYINIVNYWCWFLMVESQTKKYVVLGTIIWQHCVQLFLPPSMSAGSLLHHHCCPPLLLT